LGRAEAFDEWLPAVASNVSAETGMFPCAAYSGPTRPRSRVGVARGDVGQSSVETKS
jgi:hypothetical protein